MKKIKINKFKYIYNKQTKPETSKEDEKIK